MQECSLQTEIRTLGPCKLDSVLPYRTWADNKTVQIVVDEELSEEVGAPFSVCLEAAGGGFGAGDRAVEVELVAGQGVDEEICRGAGADADHAVLFQTRANVVHGRFGHGSCAVGAVVVAQQHFQ